MREDLPYERLRIEPNDRRDGVGDWRCVPWEIDLDLRIRVHESDRHFARSFWPMPLSLDDEALHGRMDVAAGEDRGVVGARRHREIERGDDVRFGRSRCRFVAPLREELHRSEEVMNLPSDSVSFDLSNGMEVRNFPQIPGEHPEFGEHVLNHAVPRRPPASGGIHGDDEAFERTFLGVKKVVGRGLSLGNELQGHGVSGR